MERLTCSTPLGTMTLVGEGEAITGLFLPGQRAPAVPESASPVLERGRAQLLDYLAGRRRVFDLPLRPAGTPFQRRVWAALSAIPWGETRTYGQIARNIGAPKAARAVGQANHRNPIPIFIPCHRVIGAGGALTGYGGGLELKRMLLQLEGIL
ncbi:methylated-DNA--[protein]-cysteine S-methyltransferase [Pseudoflavonifractor phocaeensis]|uniref:methylated-DNA--[protein]-cysteine S-methyltransferase n=1 Tax=Pseudoflavonifractor phocaeensis TaxID=1870988 RepID=UPI00195ADEC3|nr:methylated-DNA--[protein]-cysteine S-methyltransferase [Pseudoflavonifractor phocaeensis]MBM6938052.1 methylated-DNA--[protein]-cysteine S-methyltransferase [Pseudoflavonifractor phocaeensis]